MFFQSPKLCNIFCSFFLHTHTNRHTYNVFSFQKILSSSILLYCLCQWRSSGSFRPLVLIHAWRWTEICPIKVRCHKLRAPSCILRPASYVLRHVHVDGPGPRIAGASCRKEWMACQDARKRYWAQDHWSERYAISKYVSVSSANTLPLSAGL